MRKVVVLFILMAVALMISCSSVTVKTDYDREYDFTKFKTYRWANESEINANDELAKSPLIYKRVQAAVDKELLAKGLNMVESGDGDLVVVAHAGVKERMQVMNTGGGWYDPYWGPYGGTTHVSYYEEGTLVLDIVAWENKELAWRGMGSTILKDIDDPEQVTEYINNWVGIILKEYPPKN